MDTPSLATLDLSRRGVLFNVHPRFNVSDSRIQDKKLCSRPGRPGEKGPIRIVTAEGISLGNNDTQVPEIIESNFCPKVVVD